MFTRKAMQQINKVMNFIENVIQTIFISILYESDDRYYSLYRIFSDKNGFYFSTQGKIDGMYTCMYE